MRTGTVGAGQPGDRERYVQKIYRECNSGGGTQIVDWIDRFNYGPKIGIPEYGTVKDVVRTIDHADVAVRQYEHVFPVDVIVDQERLFHIPEEERVWERAKQEADDHANAETPIEEWDVECREGREDPYVRLSTQRENTSYEITFQGDSYLGLSGRLTAWAADQI